MQDVVITGAKRTPMGGFQGDLSTQTAPALGAVAVQAVLNDANCDPQQIDAVLMGLVLSAGVGQAPARQAALGAGLHKYTPATTISKVCGSGMKTICLGFDAIRAGSAKTVIAGGMESMSQSPYLSMDTRGGARLGHRTLVDHMFKDGLEDAYTKDALMGVFAELCATTYSFTREEQDAYALTSLSRALEAQEADAFDAEIAPVTLTIKGQDHIIGQDEQPKKARPDKIPKLKPAFAKEGPTFSRFFANIFDI